MNKIPEKRILKKKLWKVFSEYIRRRDADWKGMVACCSCGKVDHWKNRDAGHYRPKTEGTCMYFEEKNVHAQCRGCNSFRRGNLANYSLYLIRRYGSGILEELEWKSKQKCDLSQLDYLRLIEEYKEKIQKL